MKKVYYFGEDGYNQTGTLLGVMYKENGDRYDFGFLRRDLENGEEITIKQATPTMVSWMNMKIEEYKLTGKS